MSAPIPATDQWLRAVADDKRIPIIHRLALLRFGLQPPTGRAPDIIATELGITRCTVLGALDAAVRRGHLLQARPGEFIPTSGRPPPITNRPDGASRRGRTMPFQTQTRSHAPARACAARP